MAEGESPTKEGGAGQLRGVVTALLAAAREGEAEVREGAAVSLARVAGPRPLLVLTEWLAALQAEKQGEGAKETPRSKRRSVVVSTRPSPVSLLVLALAPVMEEVGRQGSLAPGDQGHRAVLGQVVAALVEEMVAREEEERLQGAVRDILVGLAKSYMDKVMDVLLVHYQPSAAGTVQACVVATLATLAYTHPHGMVPFLKVIQPLGLSCPNCAKCPASL